MRSIFHVRRSEPERRTTDEKGGSSAFVPSKRLVARELSTDLCLQNLFLLPSFKLHSLPACTELFFPSASLLPSSDCFETLLFSYYVMRTISLRNKNHFSEFQ